MTTGCTITLLPLADGPDPLVGILVPAEPLAPGRPIPLPPDLPRVPRQRIVRTSELKFLAMGAALLIPTDATTIKFFDPDLHEIPAGDEEGKAVSQLGAGYPMAIAILAPALMDGKYGRKTTGLTAMAVLNATLLTEGLKFLTGRERPEESDGSTLFHGPSTSHHSFPSGHTSAAFAAAEVLGHRYPKYKLGLYLLAAGVGLARINAAAHFPSDVFVGVGIGIYTGRLVLRHGGKIRLWR
jgi:undecaprenyl-diphosphatase